MGSIVGSIVGSTVGSILGSAPESAAGSAVPTCLIVDDSAVIRKVARRIVETLGFAAAEAEDGAEGLEACRAAMPEAILLDWNMPNVDGYSFLQEIRRMPGGERPKILFCTTENDVGAIARALRAGADEYIMKPFDRDILTAKLEQVGVVQAGAA